LSTEPPTENNSHNENNRKGKILNTFEIIEPLYQKLDFADTPEGVVANLGSKLYRGLVASSTPPTYILDTRNVIHSKKTALPLTRIDQARMDEVFGPDERVYILKKVGVAKDPGSGRDPRIEGWDDLAQYTFETSFHFDEALLAKYLDYTTLKPTQEWADLVKNIVSYKGETDPSLYTVYKAAIPYGYVMRYQPHTLVITPPNTGKTAFYEVIGSRYDKATKNTLIGTAKWTDDIARGLFDNQHYALTVEQIESLAIENVIGLLMTLLEQGWSLSGAGGATIRVVAACPFIATANPLALSGSHTAVMRDILAHLCRNSYAMGRRFGIIAFNEYAPIKDLAGTGGLDDVERKNLMETYRAMEERTTATLQKFWNHPAIKEFCRQPVYERSLYDEIEPCEVIEVRSFLLAHYAHSYHHIRGGAINMALVDNLPRLAGIEISGGMSDMLDIITEDIIEQAKANVETLKAINLASIHYALDHST
jgi:hypothetical protein